ncbi:hypothetical protein F5Y05DRAFT_330693 [Hypoxylon sp. FL0543]|nr:hypothetical protein F5Y05DRAFT_330693 [Hypoxylon sp. FL0543]
MPSQGNSSSSFNVFWSGNFQFLATIITLYVSRLQASRSTMRNERNGRTPRRLPMTMEQARLVNQYLEGTPTPPDSAISMSNNENRFASEMDAAISRVRHASVTVDQDGFSATYSLDELTRMGAELAKARAEGRFPLTTAAEYDIDAVARDYTRLVALNEARGTAPREEWNSMPNVVQLLVRITQEIRARDEITAEKTEDERVKAHVSSMMSGVGAEAKLYSIVQHAVTYAIKNGSSDQAATLTGQNMADLLNGIRGVIKSMAIQGAHGVHGVNVESVLEEVFSMIDFALGGHVAQMDGQLNTVNGQLNAVNGQLNTVNGQISQLDSITQEQVHAIGQHVNAIDNHVHSLGNNVNAFGTLLNSTNGNVLSMTTQVNLLQTIVRMLPQMIHQSIQERLPVALEAATTPIREAFEARLGAALGGAPSSPTSTVFTDISQNSITLLKQKKSKKSVFKKILKLFKKSCRKASS